MRIVCSPRAEVRLRAAREWLAGHAPATILATTYEAAADLTRRTALERGSGFGWHRATLWRLAQDLAVPALIAAGLTPAGGLPLEALCARVVQRLTSEGRLGRLAAVADRPGLPRALARTLAELRLAGPSVDVDRLDVELSAALATYNDELERARLADRALVYKTAAAAVGQHRLVGIPLLLLDVAVTSVAESDLVAALLAAAPTALATVPAGDERTLGYLGGAPELPPVDATTPLGCVQAHLFAAAPAEPVAGDDVEILSAPGENRECVEIARRLLREAARGVPFDKMAVLLRAPGHYRAHLEEALARAGVPSFFEPGAVRPDPAGRAFLALLGCAAEGLSARRFAEYLSLGQVPRDATPPAATASGDRWVPPDDDELFAPTDAPAETDETEAAVRAPWRWERLLVEAAVIGGRDRWVRRLAGLEAELRQDLEHDPTRQLADLASLREYALPLLGDLESLPRAALWGEWIGHLSALATRALRAPERVLAILAALHPMADVGPVGLGEVRMVLHPRLVELKTPPSGRRSGRVLCAPIAAARGLAFDVVFVPGLAERLFPHKLIEDPLLLDDARLRLGADLDVREHRLAGERLALRIAVGAARQRLVLSYPRIDLEQARPRVPSFYALEVLRSVESRLPGFDDLARRAEESGAARIGWPAPAQPADAIDEAEHDLALLDGVLRRPSAEATGTARYLLGANVHLARALRFRARRWQRGWNRADGLVDPSPEARTALATHGLEARSFSPTALEAFAACPYRFFLKAIHRLEPRREPQAIEELDPMSRGSLIHDVLFSLLAELRDAGRLPITAGGIDAARAALDAALERVAAAHRDTLNPAIARVWDNGIAAIRADLREWLRLCAEDPTYTPWRFELSFGLADRHQHDPASVPEAVRLASGLELRGSIDLVERDAAGHLRATDYKTGSARVPAGAVVYGGRALQPVLYAMVLEKLFGTEVAGGRLHYCTSKGGFTEVAIPLDDAARGAVKVLTDTLREHFERGFFPAAPDEKECDYCDFRAVCGPHEAARTKRKQRNDLVSLDRLRGLT